MRGCVLWLDFNGNITFESITTLSITTEMPGEISENKD
jgi:hypothetical protein